MLLVNKNMDKAIGSGSVSNLLSQDDQQVFAGETVYRASERMSLADGVQGVFETYKTPLRDSNGTIYGLLCYHREITERLRLEDERRALEKELGQARKMEAVGQLAGGIAHDFNNQLSLILGFAQLATRALANGKLDKLDDYLMEIFKAGSAAQAVVAQLLAFSRNDTAATTVLDLAPVVKETAAALSIVVGASFEFKIEIESGLPAILIGAVQVRQLLTNLVLNARDASLGAGAITVQLQRVQEAGRVVCSSCRKVLTGEFIELSVSDKGSGISADILERIFDPFFTTKDVGKGSGLGLSMVHGITHSAAGHVGVVSVPGQGTKISSYFPVGMP